MMEHHNWHMLHVQLPKLHKPQGITTQMAIHICLDIQVNFAYFCLLSMAQAIKNHQETLKGGRKRTTNGLEKGTWKETHD